MAEGIFAAYLLGYDESRSENQAKLVSVRKDSNFDFSDDDDKRAEKAGPFDLRFDVPPSEAIDYFRRKKIIPKKEFKKLSGEAKFAAFTVSSVYRDDVLQAFKDEIQSALETGATRRAVVKNFKSILAGAGHKELGNWHLEVIARTNLGIAYGIGRRKQMEAVSDLLPFWEYSAVNDDRTRPTHRACDGIILPADSPFWDTHYPPWGFACRCTIIARLDVPNGYDITKPNADTTLALDASGIPVKAEYGLSVHDLSAGRFVGVPKQGLRETIENAIAESRKTPSLEGRKIEEITSPRRFTLTTERPFKHSYVPNGKSWHEIFEIESEAEVIVRPAVELLDRIHKTDLTEKVKVIFAKPLYEGGADYSLRSKLIRIDPINASKEFDFIHEVGHAIDHLGFGNKGNFGTELPKSEWSKEFADLISSLAKSEAVGNLLKLRESRDVSKVFVNYALRVREIFARAYTQYIAITSGNPVLLRELRIRRKGRYANIVWTDTDFVKIKKAFDKLFAAKKWHTKK